MGRLGSRLYEANDLKPGDPIEIEFFERMPEWGKGETNQAKMVSRRRWFLGTIVSVAFDKFTVLLFNGSQRMDIYKGTKIWRIPK